MLSGICSAALCLLATANFVVAGQWTNDLYDQTSMVPKAKGCWNPDPDCGEFTFVVMPDTQYLFDQHSIHPVPVEKSFEYILTSSNRSDTDTNIVFMAHLGDVVQNGLKQEFDQARKVFDYLDEAGAEYSVLAGNHDVDPSTTDKRGKTPYLEAFNPERFHKIRSWRGASPTGYNNYHIFKAGGREWLVLALDWRMSNSSFEWAESVLKSHAHIPTILTTHEIVTADTGKAEFTEYGEEVWNKLIKHNNQVFLTLNGHFWPSGRTSRTNAAGNKVESHITNYQNRYYGGSGMIRSYRFKMRENKIDVTTFSPWSKELVQKGQANPLSRKEEELTTSADKFTMHINFESRVQALDNSKRSESSDDTVITGTQAYWRFDRHKAGSPLSQSDIIKDLSGNCNDLILKTHFPSDNTTLRWSDAHHPLQPGHGSLNFTAQKKPLQGMYLQTRDDAKINSNKFENGYTFEAFYYLPSSWDSEQNAWSSLFSRRGSASDAGIHGEEADKDEPIVTLSISNDRELQWRVYPLGSQNGTTNWGHETPFDHWWHAAVVNNGTMTKMYVDGSEVARNPAEKAHGLTTLNKPWMLGGFEYGGKLDQIFYGSIGDVRIVDRAISPEEFMFRPDLNSTTGK